MEETEWEEWNVNVVTLNCEKIFLWVDNNRFIIILRHWSTLGLVEAQIRKVGEWKIAIALGLKREDFIHIDFQNINWDAW